jgi:hypothetical protein
MAFDQHANGASIGSGPVTVMKGTVQDIARGDQTQRQQHHSQA